MVKDDMMRARAPGAEAAELNAVAAGADAATGSNAEIPKKLRTGVYQSGRKAPEEFTTTRLVPR